ncbi:leucine-rich repeat domain-containing protein [Clostridium sp. WILCCON 0269]|uniref:Leucine-rich repeat domain-containing protein n=1 Tax=Candidatus Clostridium eludens TaxID=3381663 RepID=A0ABW8SRJ1_9CLOT
MLGQSGTFNPNKISDISPLQGLVNLQTLDLSSNPISNISALNGLTNLQHLWLDNNQISDINSLKGLTNLKILVIGHNKVNTTDEQSLQNVLTNCSIDTIANYAN